MGTSKGYIPPKNAEWKRAKSAVTRMSGGNYNRGDVRKAVSNFAEAFATTHLSSSNVSKVAGNVLYFVQSIQSKGVEQALSERGLDALSDKDGVELYQGVVDHFATDITSTDGQIIRDSLFETLQVLDIQSLDDFNEHSNSEFLTTFIIEFSLANFEHCFSEKILANVDDMDTYHRLIETVRETIENTIVADVDISGILQMDFSGIEGQVYIQRICDDSFDLLRTMGEINYEDLD